MRRVVLVLVAPILSVSHSVYPAGAGVRSDTVVVRGIVYDSLGTKPAPLPGADVQLVGADAAIAAARFTVRSDSAGAFLVRAVPAGRYVVGFYHPALDTLGIEARDRVVDVKGDTTQIALGTPSARTIANALCGAISQTDSAASHAMRTALIIGHVRDVQTESAVNDGTVTVTWTEASVTPTGVGTIDREMSAQTRASGWFALCGIPGNLPLNVVAGRGSDSSGAIEVRVPAGAMMHLTLSLGAAANRRGLIVGHVVDGGGRAIAMARVALAGSDREALTTAAGEFSLDNVPTGTQSLGVRAIGYAPRSVIVQVGDNGPTRSEVRLERTVALPAVVVRDSIQSAHLAAFNFDKRSDGSGAQFVRPIKLEGYEQQQTVCQMIAGIIRIRPCVGPRGGAIACTGLLINGAGTRLEATDLDPLDIVGVEVIAHPQMSKYGDEIRFMKLCPIVVWTNCAGSVIPTCGGQSASATKPRKPEQ